MRTNLTNFKITPADPSQHLLHISRLCSDIFAGGKYLEEISESYIGNCHYDWDVTRLIWDKDDLIHHWGVWGYQMRLGSAQLKAAGIGAVATVQDYREQGLMYRAALSSLEVMDDYGYDLSILRGRHYVKFGFARAWNYVTYKLKAEEIPTCDFLPTYQPLDKTHASALNDLYNRSHKNYTGTAVRPTYRNRDLREMGYFGWFDSDKNLLGYVRAAPAEDDPKIFMCMEAAGDPTHCLAVLGDLFKEGKCEIMGFFTLPHQHPILSMLRRGAVIVENRYFDISGWRVRVVNLKRSLEKIRPLLESRIQNSQLSTYRGKLFLDGGEQKASLEIEDGNIQITNKQTSKNSITAGPALGRFLIGSDEPGEIIQQENINCSGDALAIVRILFPNLHPMMSHWDEF